MEAVCFPVNSTVRYSTESQQTSLLPWIASRVKYCRLAQQGWRDGGCLFSCQLCSKIQYRVTTLFFDSLTGKIQPLSTTESETEWKSQSAFLSTLYAQSHNRNIDSGSRLWSWRPNELLSKLSAYIPLKGDLSLSLRVKKGPKGELF
jgi:hypothetical protein